MQFTLDMDEKNEQGISNRDSLYQVINSTPESSKPHKDALEQLELEPEIPYCVRHVWGWFWELHSSRTSSMNGPEPLSYQEINAWDSLKKVELRPIELDIIKQLDTVFMGHVNKKIRQKSKQGTIGKKGKK